MLQIFRLVSSLNKLQPQKLSVRKCMLVKTSHTGECGNANVHSHSFFHLHLLRPESDTSSDVVCVEKEVLIQPKNILYLIQYLELQVFLLNIQFD